MYSLDERLVWARKRKKMSQQSLATAVGMSQAAIAALEAGTRHYPRKLFQIATALEVDPLWLAEGSGSPTKERQLDTGSQEAFDPRLETLFVNLRKLSPVGVDEVLKFSEYAVHRWPKRPGNKKPTP